MSQTPKKPQSRDISELKARLGLKKAGPPAQSAAARGPSGPVVPPPGLSMPAPPGTAAAEPALPDASQDPFGAMNAMAAQGALRAAPPRVIEAHRPAQPL